MEKRFDPLLEKLASLEHDQWVNWATSIILNESISEERKIRWQGFMVPYEDLSEDAKELDREWAQRVLEIVEGYVRGQ